MTDDDYDIILEVHPTPLPPVNVLQCCVNTMSRYEIKVLIPFFSVQDVRKSDSNCNNLTRSCQSVGQSRFLHLLQHLHLLPLPQLIFPGQLLGVVEDLGVSQTVLGRILLRVVAWRGDIARPLIDPYAIKTQGKLRALDALSWFFMA